MQHHRTNTSADTNDVDDFLTHLPALRAYARSLLIDDLGSTDFFDVIEASR